MTLITLQKLEQEAYLQFEATSTFLDWKADKSSSSLTFMFWDFILQCEMLILTFDAAHRDKDFLVYVEIMEKLASLFFAMDHINCAHWIPVHIRDMKNLPDSIRNEFEKQRHWVVLKNGFCII